MDELKTKSNDELLEIYKNTIMMIDRVKYNEIYYIGYADGVSIFATGDTSRGEFCNNITLKDEQWIDINFHFN